MLRGKLKKIFSSNVFYIVFSLVVSIALWMFVDISVHQDVFHPVPNVPVIFHNEDILRDRGLLIASHFPQTVTLTFDCPRSAASRLTVPPLAVEIDLANITSTGTSQVSYDIKYPEDFDEGVINRESKSVDRISLIVDRVSDTPVPVRVSYKGGTASEDLIAGAEEYDPQTIIVSGPKEIISRIASAYVPITRENLSSTYTDDLDFVLLDENGDELDESLLELVTPSHDKIRVTIPISLSKVIPLTVELMHGAGSTEQNTIVTIEPSFITVAGDPDAIKEVNSINLATIDTTRFRETTTEAFLIVIPNGLTNHSGETEASVMVEVLGLGIGYFSTSNLRTVNTPLEYRSEVRTQNLDVRIRGKSEDLELITSMNIRVVADLRDLGSGTSLVPARVFIDGVDADVGAVESYYLTVTIIKDTS